MAAFLVSYRDMTLSMTAGKNWFRKAALKGSFAIWLARGAATLTACACLFGFAGAASSCFVYVGTYTTAQSKGIYMFKFDTASGESSAPVLAAEARNASFLALSPDGRFLYAVSETDRFDGQPGGAVSAYAVDSKTGSLTLLNRVGTRGAGPCHLAVDPSGKCVVAANYGGGSVAAFPVRPDGSLGESKSFIQHKGKSVNPRRQEGPHAHGATFDSEGRFVFVPDLGLDQVLIYRVNAVEGSIMPHDPPFVSVAAGSGPRHLAFHPNGRFAYVINELANTVAVFEYDNAKGVLKHLQTASTLPDGYAGDNTTAEIEVDPQGRFVIASNRGHDSLAVFAVGSDGTLSLRGHTSTQGKTPRNFAIDPSGHWIWVGNQNSNSLVLFSFRPETGALEPAGRTINIGAPVCVKYMISKD